MRFVAVLVLASAIASHAFAQASSFDTLTRELWPLAREQGITRATFDLAFRGLTPDPRVVAVTRREPEYGKPVGEYIAGMASRTRIENGRRNLSRWADTLGRIEHSYGVESAIVVSLWGVESSFGQARPRWDVVRSLATLVSADYRAPFFRQELIYALRILQDGHVARDEMLGSWAGAMGQPQFMPSSFYEYAVDFSGDGRRDIWNTTPDVLASIANYMRKSGWTPDVPWGFEVVLPNGFDLMQSRGTFSDWGARGVRRADGKALSGSGTAYLLQPSGAAGPAFLVTENFNALKRYNNSDVYALAVGHLADRMSGGGPLRGAWPSDDPQLSRAQRIALQRRLAELGYDVKDFQGRLDFDQRDAIRREQRKLGMIPDGHPTAALLGRMGVGTAN
ncbi:MAG TPA: lytic murein transglycosylase [Xanthobacteraceae bacterium]|nr:lytic murein transglycosylase [Xanthobacteraceae bacterium]